MKFGLPVMLVALVAAAVAQDLLPGMPGSPLKVPFLSGVAVYFALNRPAVAAVVCALAAGWLTDGAGGLPPACTAAFLLVAALVLRPLRRLLLDGSFAGVILATTIVAFAQVCWQALWCGLPLAGAGGPWRMAADFVLQLPAGAVAGATAWCATHALHRGAGLEKPREAMDGVS